MNPKISVIIPVYNVENYLRACLDSILQQSFQDWECILVNDGSKDNSGEICDEYSRRDARFRVIHKANGGVSSARNRGLDIANGEWLTFVDSDDTLASDALEYMLKLNLATNADVCNCTLVQDGNIPFETKILDNKEKDELVWECLTYQFWMYSGYGLIVDGPCVKLFRLSIIRDNNIRFVEGLCKSEDGLFDAEYYHFSDKIVFDPHPIYHYTLNPGSICHTYNPSHIAMFGELLHQEESFINKYYNNRPDFQNVLKVRAYAALNQVLFENHAQKRSKSSRIQALKIFFSQPIVEEIFQELKFRDIKDFVANNIGRFDLWFAKNHLFDLLCALIDIRSAAFNCRVKAVECLKRILNISPDKSLSSLLKQ